MKETDKDMEQQKILWIILSVAVLLLVVLGAGLFMFSPSSGGSGKDADLASARVITPDEFDPIEWARSSDDYPGIEEEKALDAGADEEFVVVYGETGEKTEVAAEEKAAESVVVKELVKKESEPVKPAPVKKAPVKPAPVTVKVVKPVNVTEFWIQTGSFKSVSSAENAKQTLVSKGFTPTIQTKAVSGTTYYRVRIGPYTSKDEAEKFLHWVKGVDGFIESYVSKVYTKR
jgi:cell division septation protein DedD